MQCKKMWAVVSLCLLLVGSPSPAKNKTPDVSVGKLRVEQLESPLGIDAGCPRLSWQLRSLQKNVIQTSYRILVASSPENLSKNLGDLWDTGMVVSSESVLITYMGKPLQSNQQCYWKVKSVTNRGETDWSSSAKWTMGLLSENDWKGQWIGWDCVMPWESETK